MRGFRRPAHRIGLTGTVIAFGVTALTTLGAGAAPSHDSDAARVIRFRGSAVRRFRCFEWQRHLRCFGPTRDPFSRSPAVVGTATTEPLRPKPIEARLTSLRVVTTSFA